LDVERRSFYVFVGPPTGPHKYGWNGSVALLGRLRMQWPKWTCPTGWKSRGEGNGAGVAMFAECRTGGGRAESGTGFQMGPGCKGAPAPVE